MTLYLVCIDKHFGIFPKRLAKKSNPESFAKAGKPTPHALILAWHETEESVEAYRENADSGH